MTQLILADELVRMGAIKSDIDNFILNGISYSRGTSFSQRVQIAAEKMCQEYQEQGIKCLLVKDGIILTIWLSQPFQAGRDLLSTSPVTPEQQLQEIPATSENETNVEVDSANEETQFQSDTTEKIMTYRGNVYKVINNGKPSPDATSKDKSEGRKKRIYRGLEY
jgi:hypothetical protein